MTSGDRVLAAPSHHDVVVVRWPEQSADAERLARLDRPHLLLVEPGVVPPALTSCLADWVRLPADDVDVRSRLAALQARARNHPSHPTVDEFGELSYAGTRVFLSPIDQRIAELLVESFDRAVSEKELFTRVFDGEGEPSKVRVHISRLRKRIAALGLEVTSIRGHGYRLHAAGLLPPPPPPVDPRD